MYRGAGRSPVCHLVFYCHEGKQCIFKISNMFNVLVCTIQSDDIDEFIKAKGRPSLKMLTYFKDELTKSSEKYQSHITEHRRSSTFLQTEVVLMNKLIDSLSLALTRSS